MSPIPARMSALAQTLQESISGELYRLGHTPKSLEETQRDVLWWVYARVQAAMNLRPGLFAGWGIAWTSAGYAELVPIEVPKPGHGRVTVDVAASAVSPGTERAQYLRLPNAQVGVLGRPGYSSAGIVRRVGPGVTRFRPGDRVAVAGAAHSSVVTVSERSVFQVPPGLDLNEAAAVWLGTICAHGAAVASAGARERVAVVGAGPIGVLAFRIACLTAIPAGIIATSQRASELATSSGVPLLALGEDAAAIDALEADVVFEATGNPQAILTAISAARAGGRIVLLGSPRGVTHGLVVQAIRERGLSLIGAHVDTLEFETVRTGRDMTAETTERFLGLLASREVTVADLIGPPVDPRAASTFYRELASGEHAGGAYFDWSSLSESERIKRGHLLKPPNLAGLGMEAKAPIRPRRSPTSPFSLPSPYAGAKGRLRLGLVGCGDIAVQNAAGAAAAPNVEVTACFDPVRRLAEDLAAKHDARVVDTLSALLDSADVDAVLLSVPHHLHEPLAIQACEAGKHVIVEKPLARDLKAALRMTRAAESNGVSLSTCFPQRYDPKVQIARRLVEAGALGDLQGTATTLFLDKSPAYWQGGFSGRTQSDWRRSKERAGGGVLIMNLSHHLDLVRYLSGVEVTAVHASVQPDEGIEDAVVANLRYGNAALGSLAGFASVRGTTEQTLSLWGTEGRIIIEPAPRAYTMRPIAGLRSTRWHSFGRLPAVSIRGIYLSRVATALAEGRQPEISGADGVAVQAIIEAVYLSAGDGSVIDPAQLVAEQTTPALQA